MGDKPLENVWHGRLNGRLNFTTGNGTYVGLYSVGDSKATEYEITIPENASIKLAKLNVYYTWHYDTYCPVMEVSRSVSQRRESCTCTRMNQPQRLSTG